MQSRISRLTLATAMLLMAAAGVDAQPMYRIVGPDGRVTFTDQPPPPAAPGKAATMSVGSPAPGSVLMPLELREPLERYPVTLFTGVNCEPCDAGRNLLASRGVPFAERTVTSAQDGEALKRMVGDNSLPLMTIGGQQVKGFSDVEWNQYLDAAGYPKTSRLPPSYRNQPPTPLVATQKVVPPAAAPAPAQTADAATPPAARPRVRPGAAPVAPTEPDENPAGIRF